MLKALTNAEIDSHPLLTAEQRKLCKIFRTNAAPSEFSMLVFAEICLRATARDYAHAVDEDDNDAALVAHAKHRRAAIFYAYEALKNGPPIVAETAAERGTLRDLELLVSHGHGVVAAESR